jgi:hypothetical protein
LRFTADYLQKKIFRIVAATVTLGKVTKVTGPDAKIAGPVGKQWICRR